MLNKLLISTAMVVGMASAASAATATFSQTLGDQTTDYSGRIVGSIQQFDSSLGTLNSATITLQGTVSGGVQYESLDAANQTIDLNLSAQVTVSTAALADLIVALPTMTQTVNTTSFDGMLDFGGTSGGTITGLTADMTNSVTLTGGDLAEFIGNGFVDFEMDGEGLSYADGPGNFGVFFTTLAGGVVTVTYDFTENPAPVPLPAGAPLLLLGLGALGVARRRRG